MTVVWTRTAEEQLDAIFRYFEQDSEDFALLMVDRITRRSIQISEYPLSGRKVPEFDVDQIREVLESSYRIIYYIQPDQIEVLAVVHGAMNLDSYK